MTVRHLEFSGGDTLLPNRFERVGQRMVLAIQAPCRGAVLGGPGWMLQGVIANRSIECTAPNPFRPVKAMSGGAAVVLTILGVRDPSMRPPVISGSRQALHMKKGRPEGEAPFKFNC